MSDDIESIDKSEFVYDDSIDRFVHSFMDESKKFTDDEKDFLFEFGQQISQYLNIHRICTVLPLHVGYGIPKISEISHDFMKFWYWHNIQPNLTSMHVDANIHIGDFNMTKTQRRNYLIALTVSIARSVHHNLVKYLIENSTLINTNVEINQLELYNSVRSSMNDTPTMSKFYREIDKVTRNFNPIELPWVLGSRVGVSVISNNLGPSFDAGDYDTISNGLDTGGICHIQNPHVLIRSFEYICHNEWPDKDNEMMIIGSNEVTHNESLSVALNLEPVKCNDNLTLGIRVQLILFKNSKFGNNYYKLPISYKTM